MAADDWFGPDFEITPGNPYGYMVYAQELGMSGREALDAWRELGGTAGNQNWNRLYGQVGDALARMPDMAALAPDVIPSAGDYGTWAAGNGGKFATTVRLQLTDVDTGQQSTTFYTYMSDVAHTPNEAIAAAMADFGSDANQQAYRVTVDGGFVTGVYQTVPYSQAA
jgi:hypothetical protein